MLGWVPTLSLFKINRFPKGGVQSLSSGVFKTQPGKALRTWSETRANSALSRVLDWTFPQLSYEPLTGSNSRGHSNFILYKVVLHYQVFIHLI